MDNNIILYNRPSFVIVPEGWEEEFIDLLLTFYKEAVEHHIQYEGEPAYVPQVADLLDESGYYTFCDEMASLDIYGNQTYYAMDLGEEDEEKAFYEAASYYYNFLLSDAEVYFEWHRFCYESQDGIQNKPIVEVW